MIFFSHSNKDRPLCDALVEALRKRGFDWVFMDFDPVDGIPPGRKWEEEIYRNLRRCDVYLAADTPNWRQSHWCFAEVALARSLGKRIIVLRPPGSEPKLTGTADLARDSEFLALAGEIPTSLEPLFLELERIGLGQLRRTRWNPSRPPYPGLSPLDEADAGVFFGRDNEVREVLDLAEKCIRFGEKLGLLLIGHSGSGKSSLLRAGVLPQMRHRPNWHIFGPILVTADAQLPLEEVDRLPAGGKALIVLDQIEEGLNTSGAPELIASLVKLAGPNYRQRAFLIGTLRADSLRLLNERIGSLAQRMENFVVGPLGLKDYQDIIEKPAAAAGITVESRLIEALTSDLIASGRRPAELTANSQEEVLSTDALPILAVTLRRVWERRDGGNELRYQSYKELEGFGGIINRTAEAIMAASVLETEDQDALREAFIGMVRVDRDGRFSRRPFALESQPGRVRQLLQRFHEEGLLVTADAGCIQLAHEALIRTWPRLRSWVEEARKQLLAVERFESALARWLEDSAALLEGVELSEAEQLLTAGNPATQTLDAAKLIELSLHKRTEAIALEQRELQSRTFAESLRLATEARQAIEREPETALRVAWEAGLRHRNEVSEAAFRESLARMPAPVMLLDSGRRSNQIGFGDRTGFIFAAFEADGALVLWDSKGPHSVHVGLTAETPWAIAAVPGQRAFVVGWKGRLIIGDPRGKKLAEVDLPEWVATDKRNSDSRLQVSPAGIGVFQQGQHAWLFDVGQGQDCRVLRVMKWIADDYDDYDRNSHLHAPDTRICGIDLDTSLERVLSNCTDGTAGCWGFDGRALAQFRSGTGLGAHFASVKFLADGFVTGTLRGRGQIWDGEGKPIVDFRPESGGYDLFITDVAPSGEYFIAASNAPDHELEVRDKTGACQAVLAKHQQHYWCAVFSHDGRLVAGGCADGVIRIWDWREQRLLLELHGHSRTVHRIALSPDGRLLLSSSHDDSVRVWTLFQPILPTLEGHRGPILAISRIAGDLVTTGQTDGVSIWWHDPRNPTILPGNLVQDSRGPRAHDIVFTREKDGTVHVWRLRPESSGAEPLCNLRRKAQEFDPHTFAAASPDGSRFVFVGEDSSGEAALWSLDGEPLAMLVGASARNSNEVANYQRIRRSGFRAGSGQIVTAAEDGTCWIWSSDGRLLQTFLVDEGSPDALLDLEADPLGEFIAAGVRNEAQLWSWEGTQVHRLETSGYKVQRVCFSPDGRRLFTISDNPSGDPSYFAQLWHRSGRRLANLDAPGVSVASEILFDGPSPRFAFMTLGDAVRIFTMDGKLVGIVAASQGTYVTSVAVAPDGRYLAILFSDNMTRVWDINASRRAMTIKVSSPGPLQFSNDSRRLLIATASGAIEQIAMDISDLYPAAAARLSRGLTPEEAHRFAIDSIQLDLSQY